MTKKQKKVAKMLLKAIKDPAPLAGGTGDAVRAYVIFMQEMREQPILKTLEKLSSAKACTWCGFEEFDVHSIYGDDTLVMRREVCASCRAKGPWSKNIELTYNKE